MERRQLPRRSTRGVKPSVSPAELAQDNSLYSALFGASALEEESQPDLQQQQREQLRQARKDRLKVNIENYAYVRAFHYYFELNEVPRLEGHPSYAVDNGQFFHWSYSQDDRLIGSQPLRAILNRTYFGLPSSTGEEKKEDPKDWEETFESEEKRYSTDRMIYTCAQIAKKLPVLQRDGKLGQFKSIAKKDPELQELSQSDVSLKTKAALLVRKIAELEKKKEQLRTRAIEIEQAALKLGIKETPREETPARQGLGEQLAGQELEENCSIPRKKVKED